MKKRQMHNIMFRNMLLIAIVSFLGTSLLFLYNENNKFDQQIKVLRQHEHNDIRSKVKNEVTRTLNDVHFLKTTLDNELKIRLKARVNYAVQIAETVIKSNASDEEKKKLLISTLRGMRSLDPDEYFFIVDRDKNIVLWPPHPEMEGKKYSLFPDNIFQQEITQVLLNNKEGFITYNIIRPQGNSEPTAKLTYIKHLKPYDWYIGTGEFMDTYNKRVQAIIIKQLESIHLQYANYLFATSYDGQVILGPGQGKNFFTEENSDTAKIIHKLIDVARSGGGFCTYQTPNFANQASHVKLSYVMPVEDWGWYLGAGLPVNAIEFTITQKEKALKGEVAQNITYFFAIFALILIFSVVLARRLSTQTLHEINSFNQMMSVSANTGDPIDADNLNFYEFRKFAESVNQTLAGLKKSQAQYKKLLDNLTVAAAVSDESGKIVLLNQKFINLFGYTPSDIPTVAEWFMRAYPDPAYRQALLENWSELYIKAIKDNNIVLSAEAICHTAYDTDVNIAMSGTIQDSRVVMMFEDLTSFYLMQKELNKTQSLLAAAIENSPAGIAIIEKNELEPRMINSSLTDLLSPSGDSRAMNRTGVPYTILHTDGSAYPKSQRPIIRALTNGEIIRNEEIILEVAGKNHTETKYAYVNAAPVKNARGENIAALAIYIDISEQKKTQELLNQSQKMDAIGQLAGGIAHDFNNMLGGIIGASELIEYALEKNDDSKNIQHYLDMIINTSERAADLTSKLLAFSRKQSNKRAFVNIHDLIAETTAILKNTTDKRITIVNEFKAQTKWVYADESQIQSVLLNLGINATQAMTGGGELTYKSSNIIIETEQDSRNLDNMSPGEYVKIQICDTGTGIEPEIIDKIFEPFFTTKPQGKGTGLGLAAAHGTIIQHNGAIQVESTPGVGSVFSIILPACDYNAENVQLPKENLPCRTGNILLIEDEEIIRWTTTMILEDMGFNVTIAVDGKNGFEIFEQNKNKYDLVLLDMVMPRMNGKECYIKLKECSPEVNVIFISGYSPHHELDLENDKNLKAFLQKPFRKNDLINAINQALGVSGD